MFIQYNDLQFAVLKSRYNHPPYVSVGKGTMLLSMQEQSITIYKGAIENRVFCWTIHLQNAKHIFIGLGQFELGAHKQSI